MSLVRVVGDRNVATFETSGAPPLYGYVPANLVPGQRYSITLDPTGVILLRSEL